MSTCSFSSVYWNIHFDRLDKVDDIIVDMGRHKSRYDDNRHRSKHKKRHSSRSSSSDKETRRKGERFDRLERIVESLDRRSHVRGSCIHKGDEQMITDPSKDELVIEKWIEHVDDLATVQLGWPSHYATNIRALEGTRTTIQRTAGRLVVTWVETKEFLKQHFHKSVLFSKFFKEAALYEDAPSQALGDYCFQKLNTMRKLDQETR